MSGKAPNPNIHHQGTNSQGNDYTQYNNGGFRYNNNDASGKTTSSFYDNGKGSGFYRQNNTAEAPGYKFYENQNQGTRTYYPNGSGSGKKK